jgi:hypothetical protein
MLAFFSLNTESVQMKKYLLLVPEGIVLALTGYWFVENYVVSNHINLIALVVFLVVVSQIIINNKFLGMVIASAISLFSWYMILAVFSEFREFETLTSESLQLLLFGLLLCFLGLISSGLLFFKYATSQNRLL